MLGRKECVAQSQCLHSVHMRVILHLWVDVEKDRHIYLLMRLEPLFLKTETLDLIEMQPHLRGDHMVYSYTSDCPNAGISKPEYLGKSIFG